MQHPPLATLTATDLAGKSSRAVTIKFTIKS
jgi:hypothetical protein